MKTATLTLPDGSTIDAKIGQPIAKFFPKKINGLPVLATVANHDICALDTPVYLDMDVYPVTLADPIGKIVYRQTLCFLLAKVMHETLPGIDYRIGSSFGDNGIYWTLSVPEEMPHDLPHYVSKIKLAMQQTIEDNIPITAQYISYCEAIETFAQAGLMEKVHLLTHRNPPHITLRRCGDFYDLQQGILANRTGTITCFDLIPHDCGFILQFPDTVDPTHLQPLPPYQHLFEVYKEHARWGKILRIRSAGALNEAIVRGQLNDVINTVEALHEKKLSQIADAILARTPRPRVILIAGPSSAGKTTTAMRLCSHLRVVGLSPTLISTDNYFKGEGQNPLDADGQPDFEHIDAMDRPRLNQDIKDLLAGQSVHMRKFDFEQRRGYDATTTLQIAPQDGILVIEGIHALNPILTNEIPKAEKFLIYVSALTQLALDRNNRISTTDNRLLRRMVRDYQFRAKSPVDTLRQWASVRAGERRWIFPYQDQADAVFNTSLDYEIPILKTLAAPLLNMVKPCSPEYLKARQLSGFLQNFRAAPYESVPTNSILREYLGESRLDY